MRAEKQESSQGLTERRLHMRDKTLEDKDIVEFLVEALF